MLKEYYLLFGGEIINKEVGGEAQSFCIRDDFGIIISQTRDWIKYAMQKSEKRMTIYSMSSED